MFNLKPLIKSSLLKLKSQQARATIPLSPNQLLTIHFVSRQRVNKHFGILLNGERNQALIEGIALRRARQPPLPGTDLSLSPGSLRRSSRERPFGRRRGCFLVLLWCVLCPNGASLAPFPFSRVAYLALLEAASRRGQAFRQRDTFPPPFRIRMKATP